MTDLSVSPLNRLKSRVAYGLCIAFTAVILSCLVLVAGYLLYLGLSSLRWSFFFNDPVPFGDHPGGMRNGLVGTLILVGLASLIGIPLGMLAGVYLAEYSARSRLATTVRFTADVLSGVPSIVVGVLCYELIVRPTRTYSGWAGAAALAFIMVPIVARTTEEMLKLVPHSYREASIALGATKARTIFKVVIPSATGSLITGIMLALARVAGETAPLLFTAAGWGTLVYNPASPFPSLTAEIYEARNASNPAQVRVAWAGVLVLIALIFIINLSIRYVTRSRHKVQA